MKKGEELKPRSFTPFLEDARAGDLEAERKLRIAMAHDFNDISKFTSTGQSFMRDLLGRLRGEKKDEGETIPLTNEELQLQKRMRKFLPVGKKYSKTKKVIKPPQK